MEKLTCGLESSLLAGSVLDLAHRAFIIDVTVLAVDLSILVLGLNLERAIGRLIPERVRSIVVVTVDLLKDRHGGGCGLSGCVLILVVVLLLGHGHGGQAKNDDLDLEEKSEILIVFSLTWVTVLFFKLHSLKWFFTSFVCFD